MNNEIKEIKEKIKSEDKDVLNQSMKIIDEHLSKETDRGKSAVTRVNTLIALSGAVAAVILFFGKIILDLNKTQFLVLIYFTYTTTILFLIKSIYYSIRALSLTQVHRLSPEIIFDIQEKDLKESIRYEITWKIWEYSQMIPINTQKLFWFNRGQRNLLFSIIFFLLLGVLLLINEKLTLSISNSVEYILGIILILTAVICDFIIDRLGFWHFE